MNKCVQKGPFISRNVCNLVNNLTKRLLSTQLPSLGTFIAYFQFAVFICLIKILLSTINWNIFGHLAADTLCINIVLTKTGPIVQSDAECGTFCLAYIFHSIVTYKLNARLDFPTYVVIHHIFSHMFPAFFTFVFN